MKGRKVGIVLVLKTSLILAATFFLLCNTPFIWHKMKLFAGSGQEGTYQLLRESILIFAATFILFFGFHLHRYLFMIMSFFIFITGAIAAYYLVNMGIISNKAIVQACFDNDIGESASMVSYKLLIWIFIVGAISSYLIKHHIPYTTTWTVKVASIICLVVATIIIVVLPYRAVNIYSPFRYLNSAYHYLKDYFIEQPERINISQNYNITSSAADDLKVVLIIGESARDDHHTALGYERETNPYTKNIPNYFAFHATSCATSTYKALPVIISRFDCPLKEQAIREYSVISVFRSLGFTTHWYGNQSVWQYFKKQTCTNFYDEMEHLIIPMANRVFGVLPLDGELLPHYNLALDHKGNSFITLHLLGSHYGYDDRYPKEFAKYNPTCDEVMKGKGYELNTCPKEALYNSYDNTIVYTDYVLSKAIEKLRDKNAILIYISDHGESLGEEGRYTHGNEDAPEQYRVPLMVWVSDKFIAQNPEKYKAIQALQKKGKVLGHNHVFHSLLDCSNIKSDLVEKDWSICQPSN